MGDMADYFIEIGIEQELEESYPWGKTAPEHIEDKLELDSSHFKTVKAAKSCKYCNVSNLNWMKDANGRWRLGKNGKVHVCDSYRKI